MWKKKVFLWEWHRPLSAWFTQGIIIKRGKRKRTFSGSESDVFDLLIVPFPYHFSSEYRANWYYSLRSIFLRRQSCLILIIIIMRKIRNNVEIKVKSTFITAHDSSDCFFSQSCKTFQQSSCAQSIEQYHWSSRSKRFIDTSYFSISQDDLFRCWTRLSFEYKMSII